MEQNTSNNLPTTYAAPAVPTSIYMDMGAFENAQRVCRMLAESNLIPQQFQKNLPNTMIALEMANRLNSSPFMVMQNLYVIHGKPGFSATYVIAALNSCGRFSALRFDMSGEGDERTCVAWVTEKGTGERLEGPPVSIKMAKLEGWYGKSGSKWQTMPELMLRYRAATFFGRLYAPDILMGMQTAEEQYDVYGPEQHNAEQPRRNAKRQAAPETGQANSVDEINAILNAIPDGPEKPASDPTTEEQPAPQNEAAPAEAPPAVVVPVEKVDEAMAQLPLEPSSDAAIRYRKNMEARCAEIDALTAPSECQWWANSYGYPKLQEELGGRDSEWYQAVLKHATERRRALEEEQQKRRLNGKK